MSDRGRSYSRSPLPRYDHDEAYDIEQRYSRSRSRSPVRRGRFKRERRSRSGGRGHRSYDDGSRSRYHSRSRSRSPRRRRYSRSRSGSFGRRRGRRSRSGSRHFFTRGGVGGSSTFRENPPPSRCLGVFGLSLYTTENDLRDFFSRYGHIVDIQLVYDRPSGRSRGFGFIYFENVEDAVEAREGAIGTELDGHKIRIDFSLTKRAHTPTPGVYMGRPHEEGRSSSGHRRSRSHDRRSYSRSPRRY